MFPWNKTEDGAFQGIVKGKAISVREDAGSQTIVLEGVSPEDFSTIWADYFDLDFDYAGVRAQLCQAHPDLTKMAEFAPGIGFCAKILGRRCVLLSYPKITTFLVFKGLSSGCANTLASGRRDGFLFPILGGWRL